MTLLAVGLAFAAEVPDAGAFFAAAGATAFFTAGVLVLFGFAATAFLGVAVAAALVVFALTVALLTDLVAAGFFAAGCAFRSAMMPSDDEVDGKKLTGRSW
jgi:hypothetical protein